MFVGYFVAKWQCANMSEQVAYCSKTRDVAYGYLPVSTATKFACCERLIIWVSLVKDITGCRPISYDDISNGGVGK